MGCAAGKEVAEAGGAHRGDGDAGDGGGVAVDPNRVAPNPHQDAINEYRKTLEHKRPQTLEAYWLAGAVESNQTPPHYVPTRGPMSIHQKLPMHAANVRKRVVTALVASPMELVPYGSQMMMAAKHQHSSVPASVSVVPAPAGGGAGPPGIYPQNSASLGGTFGGDGGLPQISVASSPMMPLPPEAPLSASDAEVALLHTTAAAAAISHKSGNTTLHAPDVTTPSKPPGHPFTSMMSINSTGRRLLRPASSSMMATSLRGGAGGGGDGGRSSTVAAANGGRFAAGVGLTASVAAFAIPRWFALEQSLPSSEKVLLEAAEGKLSIFGHDSSTSSYHLARPPPLDAGHFTNQQHPGAYVLKAHYVLPDDVVVGRILLAQPLHNYTVGWIKVPVAPVTFKQTFSSKPMEQHAVGGGNDIRDNGGAADDINHREDEALTTTTGISTSHGGDDAACSGRRGKLQAEGVGYLSPDKPVYDTQLDGPVAAPFDTPPPPTSGAPTPRIGVKADASEVLQLPRHLEKYYLYVKQITALCLTMSWKVASDLDGSFTEVNHQHAVAMGPSTATNDAAENTMVTTHAAPPSIAKTQSSQAYFISLPILAASPPPSLHNAAQDNEDRVHHCVPALHQGLLLGDTSIPVYINTPTHVLFPALYDAVYEQLEPLHQGSAAAVVASEDKPSTVPIPAAAVPAAAAGLRSGVAQLSHDEVCWLSFRLKFLEWLRGTVQAVVNAHEQNPRKEPLLSARNRLQAVHIALRVGAKFQYNNQEFVAFNEHGRSNKPTAAAAACASRGPRSTLFDDADDDRSGEAIATSGRPPSTFDDYLTFVDKSRTPKFETSSTIAESQTVVLSCRLAPLAPNQPASSTFLPEVDNELRVLRLLFGKEYLGGRVAIH